MSKLKKLIYLFCLLAFFAAVTGCEKEGPAEKAGKKVDEQLEEAGDTIEDLGDKVEDSLDK